MDGIYRLMLSDLEGPANIGDPEYVTVKELVDSVTEVSGKRINVEWVKGPVGVQNRNLRQQATSTRTAGATRWEKTIAS